MPGVRPHGVRFSVRPSFIPTGIGMCPVPRQDNPAATAQSAWAWESGAPFNCDRRMCHGWDFSAGSFGVAPQTSCNLRCFAVRTVRTGSGNRRYLDREQLRRRQLLDRRQQRHVALRAAVRPAVRTRRPTSVLTKCSRTTSSSTPTSSATPPSRWAARTFTDTPPASRRPFSTAGAPLWSASPSPPVLPVLELEPVRQSA